MNASRPSDGSLAESPKPASRWKFGRGQIAILLGGLFLGGFIATYAVDEPLRRHIEQQINRQLDGYEVQIGAARFHPLGFSLTMTDLRIRQSPHPEPPVADFPVLKASVQWQSLFRGRLVADFELESPRLHIDRRNLVAENDDATDIRDKGWQSALESIYPLKLNYVRIRDGSVTYVDGDPMHPLQLTQVNVEAANIRNIHSRGRTYPSSVHLGARVFEEGGLEIDGNADFLAAPFFGVNADIQLSRIELQRLEPVAAHANLYVSGGVLDAEGHLEYGPAVREIHLRKAGIDRIAIDYIHSSATATAEQQRLRKVKETAQAEFDGEDRTFLQIDELTLTHANLGYVDESAKPNYRVFVENGDLRVLSFSNRPGGDPTHLTLGGQLMGNGSVAVQAYSTPGSATAEIDAWAQVEHAKLRSLNDLIRAYAGFDVAAGSLDLYSEIHAHGGRMRGYVKPLLSDLEIYDLDQDLSKSPLQQLYELLVAGAAKFLELRTDNLAARAGVSGSLDDPSISAWDFTLGLFRHALYSTVLPGFEESAKSNHRPNPGTTKPKN